ncbi:MAG: NAD(P)H-hydrate dehydratase [Microthrixaceae bacterium]
MIPVLTPAQMAEVDRTAPESSEVLIRRAAGHVARVAIEMMGGTYGKRVLIVAGPGNNGEDGRVAGRLLSARGVRVTVIEVTRDACSGTAEATLPDSGAGQSFDLVVDAAFGTGFRGTFDFPDVGTTPVLGVDLVSGVSGLNGLASGRPAQARRTVTFAALKPGHLFGDGAALSGTVEVVDIGLDVSSSQIHLVEDSDIPARVPDRSREDHKWRHAVWLVAGSPGMSGAARLSAAAAMRAGAGYVRVSSPGVESPDVPIEAVTTSLPLTGWARAVTDGVDRFAVVTVGPGLGLEDATRREVRELASADGFTLVIDGDGLTALGVEAGEILAGRRSPTILTPHDGEYERIVGEPPGVDRIAAAQRLADRCGAVVLLKGSTTVVADPDGQVLLTNTGDSRLATAGTGDVLTGIISAYVALGSEPLWAAAAGAHIHGRAASLGHERGLVASDVVDQIPAAREAVAK